MTEQPIPAPPPRTWSRTYTDPCRIITAHHGLTHYTLVVVIDRHGETVHPTLRWTGRDTVTIDMSYVALDTGRFVPIDAEQLADMFPLTVHVIEVTT